jgi:hypothetical protein
MNDEQTDEIEAMGSIYPTEFETIISVQNQTTYKIYLVPDPTSDNNNVAIHLIIELPVTYPTSCLPILSVEVEKGLGKKQVDELLDVANATAAENLGSPCLYLITEKVREWLVDNNTMSNDGSMYSDMMRRMQQKDTDSKKVSEKKATRLAFETALSREGRGISADPEEAERELRRLQGTLVTPESFLVWKIKFEAEMASSKGASSDKESALERPTGKQLFVLNRAGLEDALITAGEEEDTVALLVQGMERASGKSEKIVTVFEGAEIAIDESLFLKDDFDDEEEDEDFVLGDDVSDDVGEYSDDDK